MFRETLRTMHARGRARYLEICSKSHCAKTWSNLLFFWKT